MSTNGKTLKFRAVKLKGFTVIYSFIQAIDSTTRLKEGLDWFLGKNKDSSDMSESVPYVRIVKLLSIKQTGRTVVALSAIIKKLNVYQVLEKLKNAVRRYVIR